MWIWAFPQICYETYRLKRCRESENWSDEKYYNQIYSIPQLSHAIEGDKFAGLRDKVTAGIRKDKTCARILDLATGRGYQARNIWNHDYRKVCACDLVEHRIMQARQLNRDTAIEFFVGNGAAQGFPSEMFDAITISVALHDMTAADVQITLQECARIMTSGGRLLVLEPRYLGDICFPPLRNLYMLAAESLDESIRMRDYVTLNLESAAALAGLDCVHRETMWSGILCLYTFQKNDT